MSALILPPLKRVASPNFSNRTVKVDLVVVHDCEGSYVGAIGWFAQSKSQVSAHLILREDGQEATQMVDFGAKAWHAVAFNSRSIGLELAGFAAKGFSVPEWQSAANIVAWLLHKFGIPARWAEHGNGPGFCSHWDLGVAGGGHTDPTRDVATWQAFANRVTMAYGQDAPADWPSAGGIVPGIPKHFVPTPTIRKD